MMLMALCRRARRALQELEKLLYCSPICVVTCCVVWSGTGDAQGVNESVSQRNRNFFSDCERGRNETDPGDRLQRLGTRGVSARSCAFRNTLDRFGTPAVSERFCASWDARDRLGMLRTVSGHLPSQDAFERLRTLPRVLGLVLG